MEKDKDKKKKYGSMRSIFMHSDGVDKLLMGLGFIGAVGDGFTTPLVLFVTGKLMNNVGGASSSMDSFTHTINQNAVALLYIACGSWVAGFLGEHLQLNVDVK